MFSNTGLTGIKDLFAGMSTLTIQLLVMLSLIFTLSHFAMAEATGDAEASNEQADQELTISSETKRLMAVCAGCHAQDGNSAIPANPKLAGQNAKYLFKQLKDIQSGDRSVAMMTGLLDSFSDQNLKEVAAFYADQEATVGQADPLLIELGQSIYRGGVLDKQVTACAACHGANGQGMAAAGFPALSGQHAAYTEAQMKLFRAAGRDDLTDQKRTNDGETKMMQSVAAKLSDKEIKALSSYISGLH